MKEFDDFQAATDRQLKAASSFDESSVELRNANSDLETKASALKSVIDSTLNSARSNSDAVISKIQNGETNVAPAVVAASAPSNS